MPPATRGADEQAPRLAILTLVPLTPYLDSLIGFVPDHISTVCYRHHLLGIAPTPDGLLHHEAPGMVATD
ncbi:MAG: hypothetical protein ACREJ6_09135 [Candidatus Methylomirabilis sp.]